MWQLILYAVLVFALSFNCMAMSPSDRQRGGRIIEDIVTLEQVKKEVDNKVFNLREILNDVRTTGKVTDSDRLSLYNRSLSQLLNGRTLLTYEAEEGRPDELGTVIKSLILSSNSAAEAALFITDKDSTGKTAFDRAVLNKDFFLGCGNTRILIGSMIMLRTGEYLASDVQKEMCSPCPIFSKLSQWWSESNNALEETKSKLQGQSNKMNSSDANILLKLDRVTANVAKLSLQLYTTHSTIDEKMSHDYDDVTTFLVRSLEVINKDISFLQTCIQAPPKRTTIFRFPFGRLF